MIDPPSFALFDELLGCRTDDPRLFGLYQTYGLGPLPEFLDRDDCDGGGAEGLGWSLGFKATVRVPGCHPSVRARGALLGYLTKIFIEDRYELPVRDGLTTALPEPEARKLAVESMVAEYGNIVHVLHRDERSTFEVRYFGDGRFIWYLLTLNELDEDDPKLLGAAPAAREIPALPEPSADEPFPAALRALYDYQDAHGFEIDFEMHDRFEFGGLKAWTGNADAEREFRVFAQDGGGGLVAFWLVHDGRPVERQPVVFLDSEGDVFSVAKDLCDFVYLLAAGVGVRESEEDAYPQPAITRIAEEHLERREGRTIKSIGIDSVEYSDVQDRVDALNRWP